MRERITARPNAVYVLATTFEATHAALTAAIPLARGTASPLVVFVPRIVPFALPLDRVPGSQDLVMRRYRNLVRQFDGEAQVLMCVCRRIDDIVRQLLPSAATVVVAGHAQGWLPTEATKLVSRLTALGHHVVFVPIPHNVHGRPRLMPAV